MPQKKGFALLSPARRSEIAAKGARAAGAKGTRYKFNSQSAARAASIAHEKGTAHKYSSEEARIAGRKGAAAQAARRLAAKAEEQQNLSLGGSTPAGGKICPQ